MDMRVLVTGAQGCIGAWVTKSLRERQIDVLLFDRDAGGRRLRMLLPAADVDCIPAITGSVEDTALLARVVREEGITHVIHLAAALIPFCQAHPVDGALANVIGTLNIFAAARAAGRPVRIVYASSAAVWGPEEFYGSGKVTEQDPLKPQTHYGVFKQANEGNARVFFQTDGISSIGLRPWSVYGVGRDQGLTADPTLAMRAAVAGERYQIRVTGQMDLQYAGDVAEAFVRCLLSDLEGAHVFNLEGAVVTMQELIHLIEELYPSARGLLSCAGPRIPVVCRMDGSELRSKIGGAPQTPLRDGVRDTLERFARLRGA
jgi:nucleoside-diphosphate-sugar epimerase